jgi:hypothetical protein
MSPNDEDRQSYEVFDQERQIHFATVEFADAVEDNGFMVMIDSLVKELKRRGYVSSDA